MKKIVKVIIFQILIVIFLISAFYFNQDLIEYYKIKKAYFNVSAQVKRKKEINWNRLWKINKDIVAWIEVPNTSIDYPIVKTRNNSEYLYKDIKGNSSKYGAIFLDERLYKTNLKENPNNIIYGHNMGRWTDVMFGVLKEYLSSYYIKGHEKVILYTPDETHYYRVAAVEYATAASSVYQIDFKDKSFPGWVKEQINNSLYRCMDKDIIDAYTDNFTKEKLVQGIKKHGNTLTLSTCDTTHNTNKKICVFCISE